MFPEVVDNVLRGGLVFDGDGGTPFQADVAFSDGLIVAVGDLKNVRAAREIDVTGKAVAPGFIDSHSHDDYACIRTPDMTAKISQGVTTVVVGNCGLSIAPLRFEGAVEEPFNLLGDEKAFAYASFAAYAEAISAARPAVNVAALVGHTTLRKICMNDLTKPASPDERKAMQDLLANALRAGAAGLSSGVYYPPAYAADLAELTALAETVSAHGGVYATHIRSEYDGVAEALQEAFATTRAARTPLIISHHKCAGVHNWGRSAETLGLIGTAAKTQPVCMDCYPYTAGSSVLNPDLCDGEIRVLINSSQPYPEMAGRYLKEIAAEWGLSERAAARRMMPGYACYFQIHEDDMKRILSHPLCMVGSDGLPNDLNPHPRLWGTFPRVLGHYARDLDLFPLAEAVAKMTGFTARRFGFSDRGRIKPGLAADITVFDPATVADRATFEAPVQISAGIEEVFVGGVQSWSQGRATGERSGRFIRGAGLHADAAAGA
ncbi:D-aminoacylase [Asticcacaulis sp. EMRT-3]|uniref:N-acyl-D-amino-acid deacylase family protein n=1 Tax=Asticcacaulis sp. EMRT-3 TaxID=3040349 RepID=UPI0024AF6E96|nr:D-aminoacylase [Asticcacaulis sp. EMRT-3]MDI7775757.1 D-aminoacylase [Asticcacaulis sp. EMRT-3]